MRYFLRERIAGALAVSVTAFYKNAMTKLLDISSPIDASLKVWPGDTPFSYKMKMRIADGANYDLGEIHTTVHVGSHADAPSHYRGGEKTIDACPLDAYYGPCEVLAVNVSRGARIYPKDIPSTVRAPRVLFKTGSFPDTRNFNEDFVSLSPELISHLHAQGVVLVGIDTPSVDPFDSKALESHQALADTDMRNLEGLVLRDVAPGIYTLIALPLRLAGVDASPVRAVLVDE